MARDGTRGPWPPTLPAFTFTDAGELAIDAGDRTGAALASASAGTSLAIGRGGHLRAATAAVPPDNPCWHESAAGRYASFHRWIHVTAAGARTG